MSPYPRISRESYEQLKQVQPSLDGDLEYRPCTLTLKNGRLVESRERLPPDLATKLYQQGESGMGYSVFCIHFRGGGNALDFVTLPEGRSATDIVRVSRLDARDVRPVMGPDQAWCIFDGVEREGEE